MAATRGSHQRRESQQDAYGNSAYQPDARQGNTAQYDPYRGGSYNQRPNQQERYQQTAYQQSYRQAEYQHARQVHTQENPYVQRGYNAGQYQGYSSQEMNEYLQQKKKKHPVRNTIVAILIVVIIVGAFGGYTGYTLYNSAKAVKDDAAVVMSEMSDLKDQILAENPTQANATAQDIAKRASNMRNETSGWAWKVASIVPVYGDDIVKVRELSGVLDDLSSDAIVPLVAEVSQISIKNLLTNGAINVDLANRAVMALNNAAPVISAAATKLDSMGDAKLEQINGPLVKARDTLDKLNTVTEFVSGIAPTFTDMLGANGQRRTYLVIAQGNTEIRSTAGFIGSIGPLYLDNGKIAMGDFRTVADIYPDFNDDNFAPITDEEREIFGNHISYQMGDANYVPDFARVSEILKYSWEHAGYEPLNGVIGCDPVFLQHMLAITGPITTSNGTVVDGTNAGRLLLHDVYYMPTQEQDPFFEEVASLAFMEIMSNLGNMPITDFVSALSSEIESGRLRVWMAEPNEEKAVETIGADGKLPHDPTQPVLGVYFNDESYAKIEWYFKAETSVGDGVKNPDGSMTYPVAVTYRNTLQPNEVDSLADYMKAHNAVTRSKGEEIIWVMLSAPEGGKITDLVCTEGEFFPPDKSWRVPGDGSTITGTMTEATLQGLDFWYGLTRTLPGDSFSLNFNVTTSPQATEPLKVFRTPTAQEVAGW